MTENISRRVFIGGVVLTAAEMVSAQSSNGVPMRPLGKSGVNVSAIGVGGYHLGSAKDISAAKRIVDEAIDGGINFFDNCWDYHDGKSEEWLGEALHGKRDKAVLMTKVCTHGRD